MMQWKNIVIGFGLALAVCVAILFARGTSEVFIYNNF